MTMKSVEFVRFQQLDDVDCFRCRSSIDVDVFSIFREYEDRYGVQTSFGRLHRRSCEFCREEQQCVGRDFVVERKTSDTKHIDIPSTSREQLARDESMSLACRQIVAQITSETNPLVNRTNCAC